MESIHVSSPVPVGIDSPTPCYIGQTMQFLHETRPQPAAGPSDIDHIKEPNLSARSLCDPHLSHSPVPSWRILVGPTGICWHGDIPKMGGEAARGPPNMGVDSHIT
jgi:hypothetical protein